MRDVTPGAIRCYRLQSFLLNFSLTATEERRKYNAEASVFYRPNVAAWCIYEQFRSERTTAAFTAKCYRLICRFFCLESTQLNSTQLLRFCVMANDADNNVVRKVQIRSNLDLKIGTDLGLSSSAGRKHCLLFWAVCCRNDNPIYSFRAEICGN